MARTAAALVAFHGLAVLAQVVVCETKTAFIYPFSVFERLS